MRFAVLALLLACTRSPAPQAGALLVRDLPQATQVPPLPEPRVVLRLDEVHAPGDAVAIPFSTPRLNWPVVVRMQLRRRGGALPAVGLRALSDDELRAFGNEPRALPEKPPGEVVGGCYIGAESGEWVSCQRFEFFEMKVAGGLITINAPATDVRHVEVVEAEMPSPLAPQTPLLHGLARDVPQREGAGVVSWRNALAAPVGGRYVFPLHLPKDAELRVALGLQSRAPVVPTRFVVRLDGKVLLDEVVSLPRWQEREVPLASEKPDATLELETSSAEPGKEPSGVWGDPRVVQRAKRPSIVLVTMDAVRPDHMSVYGYKRDTTPNLELAAKAGVLFDRATANAPRTWQSVLSFLTGRYPTHTGVRQAGTPLDAAIPTLPEVLSRYGYDTFGGTDVGAFPPAMLSRFGEEQRFVFPPEQVAQRTPAATAAQMQAVAKRIAHRPTFAWFHLENAHYPIRPSEPARYDPGYRGRFEREFTLEDRLAHPRASELTADEAQHLRALYDGGIRDADAMVGVLIRALIENNVSEDTILVIAADHGELLGEHDVTLEHSTWFDRVLHVPLVVIWPSQLEARRVAQRVQLVDLMPTLLSMAGVPAPAGLDGRDLSPLLRGETLPDVPAYSEVNPHVRVMYRGDEKLVAATKNEVILLVGTSVPVPERALFDVAKDPDESNDLARSEPERLKDAVAALKLEVDREHHEAPAAAERHVGQAAITALRQAGYLAGHAGVDEDVK